jgi:hypothetical protein
VTPRNTYTAPRWVGYLLAAVGLLALVLAMAQTPLIDWETGDFVYGGALAIFVVGFFVAAIRGRINLIGNMKGRTAQAVSVIGLFVCGIGIGNNEEFGDDWAVSNILFLGIFAALAVMFFASFSVASRKIRDGQ